MSFDQAIQALARRSQSLKEELTEVERASALLIRLASVELGAEASLPAVPGTATVKQTGLPDWVRAFFEQHPGPIDGAELLQRILERGEAGLATSARSELPAVLEAEVAAGRLERSRKTRLWSTDVFCVPTRKPSKVEFNVR